MFTVVAIQNMGKAFYKFRKRIAIVDYPRCDYFKEKEIGNYLMSTLPSPATKEFAASTIEKQVYTLTENLKEFLPIANDRNRLGYSLYKFMTDQGDEPLISVKSAKLKIVGISDVELAKKIEDGLKEIHKS